VDVEVGKSSRFEIYTCTCHARLLLGEIGWDGSGNSATCRSLGNRTRPMFRAARDHASGLPCRELSADA
jgi:hypothetical protein